MPSSSAVQFAVHNAQGAYLLRRVVGGAHQGAALHPTEADFHPEIVQFLKFFGGVVARNRQVLLAGLQILADGQDVHPPGAQIAHHFFHFVHRFAQPDHDTRLGEHFGVQAFGVGEGGPRPGVVILRLDGFEKARDGLHVVVENLRAGVHHDFESLQAALEIGDEHLDGAAGVNLADAADEHGENRRAAVAALVTVDAGNDGVLQVHRADGLGDAFRLQPVQGGGHAVFYVAEAAGAGADVAEHQEGGRARSPALAQVGAHGLLADGVQGFAAHQGADLLVSLAGRGADANPGGTPEGGGVHFCGVNAVSGRCFGHGGNDEMMRWGDETVRTLGCRLRVLPPEKLPGCRR